MSNVESVEFERAELKVHYVKLERKESHSVELARGQFSSLELKVGRPAGFDAKRTAPPYPPPLGSTVR